MRMATLPKIVTGLLLQSIVSKCVQNLKFVGIPVTAITVRTMDSPTLPFSRIFNGLLF